ncbi:MAG TPA: type II secretion system F family protein, partial [bacterium]|nr:type II secretion system F family protein [bacterium]
MPFFEYRAVNKKGKDVVDIIEAANNLDALNKVRELGLYPIKVAEKAKGDTRKDVQGPAAVMKGLAFFKEKKVKPQVMVIFIRQFATLINAGLPLLRSVKVLWEQQRPGALKSALEEMSASVESGSTFSEALQKRPEIFSKLFVNMVKAGEAAGVMDVVLLRLADFYEKSHKIRAKVKSALIYPVIVVCAAIGVLFFLVLFIIPKFAEMFKDMDLALPTPTRILIGITNLMLQWYTWVVAAGVIAALVTLFIAISRTPAGRYRLDKIKLDFPLFGVLVQKVGIAR